MSITGTLIALSVLICGQPDTLDFAEVSRSRNAALSGSAPARVVGEGAIRSRGLMSLHEALGTLAGVSIRDHGGIGGLKTVSIRNFGSQHTGIVYDGITISNAVNGQVDIGGFNLDEVSSISVDISGSDDIFRSARQAGSVGSVSISSSEPYFQDSATHLSARISAGSFGTFNPYLKLGRRLGGRWTASAWINGMSSEGNYPYILKNGSLSGEQIRRNSDVLGANGEINIYGYTGMRGKVHLKASLSCSDRGLPGSVVFYTGNPEERLKDMKSRVNLSWTGSSGRGWKLRSDLGWAASLDRYSNNDPKYPVPLDDRYLQQELSLSGILLWSGRAGWSASLAEDCSFSALDASIPGCPYPRRLSSWTALSARYEKGGLTAAATLLGTVTAENALHGKSAPGYSRLSPSACASYRIPGGSGVMLRASFRESCRLPSFNDLYYPRVGSRNLRPETAIQGNIGATWSREFGASGFELTADGYRNKVRDKIVASPTMFIWTMRNVGRVDMDGADISAAFARKFSGRTKVRAEAGWSFQKAIDVTDPEASNYRHQIAYTPRNCGSAALTLTTPLGNISWRTGFTGERFTLAQNDAAHRIEPFTEHNLSISRSWELRRSTLHLSAEVLNLGNVNYEIIKFYPMPGRHYRISLKITDK